MRQTVGHSVATAAVAIPVVLVAGPWVLGLFGSAYESQATTSLRILAFAILPLIVRYHFVAISRVLGMLRRAALLVAATCVLELASAAAGGVAAGLTGLTLGWVGAVCLEALIMWPVVRRAMSAKMTISDPVHAANLPAPLRPGMAVREKQPAE